MTLRRERRSGRVLVLGLLLGAALVATVALLVTRSENGGQGPVEALGPLQPAGPVAPSVPAVGAGAEPSSEPADAAPGASARREIESSGAIAGVTETPFVCLLVDASTRAPVERATVTLVDPATAGLDEPFERSASSDAAGRVDLPWPADLAAWLRIEHPDYAPLRRPDLAFEVPVPTIELVPAGSIEGRVVGAEPDRLEVLLWHRAQGKPAGEPHRATAVGADGAFRLTGVEAGEVTLVVVGPTAPLAIESGILVEAGRTRFLDLGPFEGVDVVVRARHRGGSSAPLVGCELEVVPAAEGVSASVEALARRVATTDGEGRVQLAGVTAGSATLTLRAPWGATLTRSVQLAPPSAEFDLALPVPGRIAGSVRWGDGRAAGGARVFLLDQPRKGEHLVLGGDAPVASTLCEPDGSFAFDQVPSQSPLMLCAAPPGELGAGAPALATRSARHVPAGTTRTDFAIVLEAGGSIEGRLRDGEDAPIGGLGVGVELPFVGGWIDWGEVQSDREGRFRISDLPAGRVRIVVDDEGYRRAVAGVDVPQGGTAELELELEPTHALECLVLDEAGFAVNGAVLVVRSQPVAPGERKVTRGERVDGYGRARISRLGEGTWLVEARAHGWGSVEREPREVSIPGAPLLTFVLRPEAPPEPATIEGELVSAADGAPLPGLSFDGSRGGTVHLEGTRFRLTGVRPGRVRLLARAPGYETVPFAALDAGPGASVQLGRREVRAATRVRLQVVDESGRALRGARVELSRKGERNLRLHETGAGTYEHSGVPRRDWTLVVRDGKRSWKRPLSVRGANLREQVVFRPRASGGRAPAK